jgi:hypothetical protein
LFDGPALWDLVHKDHLNPSGQKLTNTHSKDEDTGDTWGAVSVLYNWDDLVNAENVVMARLNDLVPASQ